jgi:tetratricopeptide (TPR) repeat protein
MTSVSCEEIYVSLIDEGATLFAQGEYFASQRKFWQAFRLRPSAPIVLFNLGRTMEELKDPNAIDFYEAAAMQGNVDASYQLATLYSRNVDVNKDAAIHHLKLYLAKNKGATDECAKWARQTLNQLEPPKPMLKLVWKRVA